jgi:hypothetical protein
MAKPYSYVRVAAHTPFTGKGSGFESVEKNIEAVKRATSIAMTELGKLKDGDDVLTIFVAPEGTWKKKDGAYGFDELSKIYAACQALSNADKDVLFFFGSALWAIPGGASAETLKKTVNVADARLNVANFANKKKELPQLYASVPVFYGGKLIYNINEQFGGDGAALTRFDFDAGPTKGNDYWSGTGKKFECLEVDWNGAKRTGSYSFTSTELLEGNAKKSHMTHFGLETGRASTNNVVAKLGKGKVDIQVLLSGGAPFDAENLLAVRPYGVAIQCEGNTTEYKKFGLKVFTIEEPLFIPGATTAGMNFYGDDKVPVVVYNRKLPLMMARMKAGPRSRPREVTMKEYEEYRETLSTVTDNELKEIYKKNLELTEAQIKPHKEFSDELWFIMQDKEYDKNYPHAIDGVGLGFFLGVNKDLDAMFYGLGDLDDELYQLAKYLQNVVNDDNLCWIQGPIKKKGKAMQKTIKEYDGAAWKNKDFVRGTLVSAIGDLAKDKEVMKRVDDAIKKTCVKKYGLEINDSKVMTTDMPKDKNPCGYSGANYKLLFKGHGPAAEIQVNTQWMMYSKHSKKLLVNETEIFTNEEYEAHKKYVGIRGAMHHVLYDIYGKNKDKPIGAEAAQLSIDYCEALRNKRTAKENEALKGRLDGFAAKLKAVNSSFEKEWNDKYTDNPTIKPW